MRAVIRFAKPSDAPAIYDLICELADYEKEPRTSIATNPEIIAEQLASEKPPFECLVAETEGQIIVGFALFFQNYSTWEGKPGLYLEDFFVKPELRGKGIGRQLFHKLLEIAKERGYGRVDWSVLHWNMDMKFFSHSVGGVEMNDWKLWHIELV